MSLFSEYGYGPIRGMFSIDHLLFTVLGLVAIIALLVLTKNKTKEQIDKYIKIIFIVVAILEVLKIIWNFCVRTNLELINWVPLYFCSIFIYASGMYSYGKGLIRKIGLYLIVYGQIIGGIVFLLYPASSVGIQPLVHILTMHSWVYHVLTGYVGIVLIIHYFNEYKFSDIKIYGITILGIELFVYLFNIIFDTNLMFINEPGVIEPLNYVLDIFGAFYPLVIGLFQGIGTFILSYGIIKIVRKIKNKDLRIS